MKVAVYYKNNDIRIEDRLAPAISDGEILVKMKACGICGTDVMEWYRIKKAPRVLGHEMAGEIVAVGKDVDTFNIGDRVFVSHHVPCYIADATMIEPLACIISGQKHIEIKEDRTILIIGSGISGLLHIQLARSQNARVIATDIDEYRLMKALESGADHVIHAGVYTPEKLRELNQDRLADIVIVCASARQAVENAFSSVDRKGTILFFAVPDADVAFPYVKFWRDEITVTFSYGASPDDLRTSLELIASGTVNVRDMITHRVALSDIQTGFNLASDARNSLKVVIVPDSDV
ncbi:MAG: zinc-binding dehydrogenase [Nitrospirae bacterium]|nr:zinc-binding dehydrogenase [Nitrospirota bacterium]